jgi:regulatory protein YycI of two-component signal transduction system YycFG
MTYINVWTTSTDNIINFNTANYENDNIIIFFNDNDNIISYKNNIIFIHSSHAYDFMTDSKICW